MADGLTGSGGAPPLHPRTGDRTHAEGEDQRLAGGQGQAQGASEQVMAGEQGDGSRAGTPSGTPVAVEAGHISQVQLIPGLPVRLPLLAPSEWRPTMCLKDVLDGVRDVLTLHTCREVLRGQGQAQGVPLPAGPVQPMIQQGVRDSSAMDDDAL